MKQARATIALLSAFLLSTFSAQAAPKGEQEKRAQSIGQAIAVLRPTEGNKAGGVVTFTREKNGVRVVGVVDGLSPGVHGFHIHEYGDCSAPDAESAGGHFNPRGNPHGGPRDQKRHAGDLGNIVANVHGNAYYEETNSAMSLEGSDSIVGRAVVVHANPDDLKTQPTGGSGARVACGVIRWNK
jgi:Cu-Zn family superoxide dismutase